MFIRFLNRPVNHINSTSVQSKHKTRHWLHTSRNRSASLVSPAPLPKSEVDAYPPPPPSLLPKQKHPNLRQQNVPLRMLLIGSPGAGKGTQSKKINERFDVQCVSSGDLLRRNIAAGTKIGQQASEAMAKGALVPDDIMVKLLGEEISSLQYQNWLLDGFPRNQNQAIMLDEFLSEEGKPLNMVINLDVPEDVILQRILDRWVHIPSGRVYNLSYNPPKRPGLDDVTGEPLQKRPDDNVEVFSTRLKQYRQQTLPLLEYYDHQGILYSFTGETSDEIYPMIEKELLELFFQ
ncbi:uncharacterized protein VTP21DRAFT_10963 [Calcarisporiella thermophila]|uniref:uncharacterized protein n=1 Tax=Calcarisporiella thermophila TaxID=911321 RepID=UPI003743ABA9